MWATNQSKPLPQVRSSVGLTPSPGMHGMPKTLILRAGCGKYSYFFHKVYACAHLGKKRIKRWSSVSA